MFSRRQSCGRSIRHHGIMALRAACRLPLLVSAIDMGQRSESVWPNRIVHSQTLQDALKSPQQQQQQQHHLQTAMKVVATLALVAASVASFANAYDETTPCGLGEYLKLAPLATNPNLQPCQTASGWSMLPPSGYPTPAQLAIMCSNQQCLNLLAGGQGDEPRRLCACVWQHASQCQEARGDQLHRVSR
ncbi:hypothetical protein PINS_up022418 [Pythium insidiosum]|nr:hypothetical protein PINS_up022418 [Pythium insidiosum]